MTLSILFVAGSVVLNLLTFVVLLWTYRHTRLVSVLAYLIWMGVSIILPFLFKRLVDDAAMIANGRILTMPIGEGIALFSFLMGMIHKGLFFWMILSLVRRACPGISFPWKTPEASSTRYRRCRIR